MITILPLTGKFAPSLKCIQQWHLVAILAATLLNSTAFAQIQLGCDIAGEGGGDEFGTSVSMPDPSTVAIGATRNDKYGNNAGQIQVYDWNGSAWLQKGSDIHGEASEDEAGTSVSMPDAKTLAIGAPNGDNSGHVRVHNWNGSAWLQKGSDIHGEAAGDAAGTSVSMPDAKTLAIGAPYNNGNGDGSGHVRVYDWNGNAWVQKGGDINGDTAYSEFGHSVSMPDASTVAIGDPEYNGTGIRTGYVRVYKWDGSAWVEKGSILDGEADEDRFGYSVSMPDAGTVAIGGTTNGNYAGHVRVYNWNGRAWVQKGSDLEGEAAYDQFGYSVSMPDAGTVAIGAINNDGKAHNGGHVRIYSWDGNGWKQIGKDIEGRQAGEESGSSVSMPDTNTVAIGAHFADGFAPLSGLVRVYSDLSSTPSSVLQDLGSKKKLINVYPNPSLGKIAVENRGHQPLNFDVTTIAGKLIKRSSLTLKQQKILDLSQEPPGIYILKFRSGEKILETRRIIKE